MRTQNTIGVQATDCDGKYAERGLELKNETGCIIRWESKGSSNRLCMDCFLLRELCTLSREQQQQQPAVPECTAAARPVELLRNRGIRAKMVDRTGPSYTTTDSGA